jgi:hypothetical protein
MPLSPYTRFLTFLKAVCELYQFPDTIDDEDNFTTRLYYGVLNIVDGHNPSSPEDWKHVYSDVERLMNMWDTFVPKGTPDAAAYLQLSQLIMEQLEQNQNPPFKIDPPAPFSSYAPASAPAYETPNVAVVPCEVPRVAVDMFGRLYEVPSSAYVAVGARAYDSCPHDPSLVAEVSCEAPCEAPRVAVAPCDIPDTIDIESVTGVTDDGEPTATPEESEAIPATLMEAPATPEEVTATPEEVTATPEEVTATPEEVTATEEAPGHRAEQATEEPPATEESEEVPGHRAEQATEAISATSEEAPGHRAEQATPEEVTATPEEVTATLMEAPGHRAEQATPEAEEEQEEEQEEEEGMEVEPIKIKGKNYWIDTATHKLYAVVGEDDVGDEVGAIVAGKAVFL